MADSNMQLHWTDEQWNKVRQVVYEEARRARVAGNVLPLFGPLEPDARYVSNEVLSDPPASNVPGITVTDTETLKLSTLQVKVYLRGTQVADPELTSALTAFRRAANILARLEDRIIFNGQQYAQEDPFPPEKGKPPVADSVGEVLGGQPTPGLFAGAKSPVRVLPKKTPDGKKKPPGGEDRRAADEDDDNASGERGEALVSAISQAVGDLEGAFHLGPFACVLGQQYFTDVQTPNKSLVLPQDRILPFLGGGALLRTSVLGRESGVVIALGGAPIDLVVGTDVSVNLLQVTVDPWFVFRVYEKIVLRIKQPDAIVRLIP